MSSEPAKKHAKYLPILSYLGGKRRYLSFMEKHRMIPTQIDHYIEPFVGGGAVFAHVNNTREIKTNHINDIDKHLTNMYKYIKQDATAFLNKYHSLDGNRAVFDTQLAILNRTTTGFAAAVAYKFVKTYAFSSLIVTRVDNGKLRAAFHPFKRSKTHIDNRITAFAELLQKTKITNTSYSSVNIPHRANTFVFLDPPYDVLTNNAYVNHNVISMEDILAYCNKLDKAGVRFVLSYNYRPEMRQLFSKYNIKVISSSLHVRRNKDGENTAKREIFIWNGGK